MTCIWFADFASPKTSRAYQKQTISVGRKVVFQLPTTLFHVQAVGFFSHGHGANKKDTHFMKQNKQHSGRCHVDFLLKGWDFHFHVPSSWAPRWWKHLRKRTDPDPGSGCTKCTKNTPVFGCMCFFLVIWFWNPPCINTSFTCLFPHISPPMG